MINWLRASPAISDTNMCRTCQHPDWQNKFWWGRISRISMSPLLASIENVLLHPETSLDARSPWCQEQIVQKWRTTIATKKTLEQHNQISWSGNIDIYRLCQIPLFGIFEYGFKASRFEHCCSRKMVIVQEHGDDDETTAFLVSVFTYI